MMKKSVEYDVLFLEEFVNAEMSMAVVFGEKRFIDGVEHDVIIVQSYPYSDVVSPDKVYKHLVTKEMFMYYPDFIECLAEVTHSNLTGRYKFTMESVFIASILFEQK